MQPVIKWSGSKRSQVREILRHVPTFNRYYEPFVGGGSVMYTVAPLDGVCGDICLPLIKLWHAIQDDPEGLYEHYNGLWEKLQKEGQQVYYGTRDRFNEKGEAGDLFFLSRTCTNGLIRFNKDGKFNNSFHITRKGIEPQRLKAILLNWSKAVQGIEFRHGSYENTTADIKAGDFAYLDPPYFNTKGMYYGTIDYDALWVYLEHLNAIGVRFALSFDGKRGEDDMTAEVPKGLYKQHLMLASGKSSFNRLYGKQTQVLESLYLNY